MTTYTWRISRRIADHMSGTGIAAGEPYTAGADPEVDAAGLSLMEKLRTKARKDGSRTVDLTPLEAGVLVDYIDTLRVCSSDELGPQYPDNTADYNAAGAFLRRAQQMPAAAIELR